MKKKKKVILFYGKTEVFRDWCWMPINLLFLASMLLHEGYDVIIIDERVTPDYAKQLLPHLPEALLFGISSFSGYQIRSGLKAADFVRKARPDLKIVWGGPHPSSLPKQTLESPLVDIVVRGQGERALIELTRSLDLEKSWETIPGIAGSTEGEFFSNLPQGFDIDALPELPFSLLDINRYINPQTRALNYTTSIGCSGCCTFCFWDSSSSNNWQAFESARVLDDIEILKSKYGLKIIKFMDANFFADESRVIEISEGLLKRKINIKWNAEGRIDEFGALSEESLKLFEKAGLNSVFFGLESTSPRILKLMNKKTTAEQALHLVEKTLNRKFKILFSLMFGVPTETIEDLKITGSFIEKSLKLNPKIHYQKSVFAPYPGTGMFNLSVKMGYQPPRRLEDWQSVDLQSGDFKVKPAWFSENIFKVYKDTFTEYFPEQNDYLKHLITES